MQNTPRLLVLSHVLPFPQSSGQQQRVFYTLKALRNFFHITFASSVAKGDAHQVRDQLLDHCDDVALLPSVYQSSRISKTWHQAAGGFSTLRSGLKFSNYVIGQLEFSPARVSSLLASKTFDCVLFEYWHAADSARIFRERGTPCLLDMHDILWQAHARQLDEGKAPEWWKRRALNQYKKNEEESWEKFDGVIAINHEELKYVERRLPDSTSVFYAPMGTDLMRWPYFWRPSQTPKVAYYGGLSSRHNQDDALKCAHQIMPRIWEKFPKAELWLIGSNPPERLKVLSSDPRIKVTGYVDEVGKRLGQMSVVVCPWTGRYGFRSRLIEVLATGVPLVASNDAVWGMGLTHGEGIMLGSTEQELIEHALRIIQEPAFAKDLSSAGRQWVEDNFSFENTYGKFGIELSQWLHQSRQRQEYAL